jgi:hypothetical protein
VSATDPVERLATAAQRAATHAGKAAALAEQARDDLEEIKPRLAALEARVSAVEHPWWQRTLTKLADVPLVQRAVAVAVVLVVVTLCVWLVPGLQTAIAGLVGVVYGAR